MSLTATCAGTALAGMVFAGTVFVETPPCSVDAVCVVVDTAAFIVVILAPFLKIKEALYVRSIISRMVS